MARRKRTKMHPLVKIALAALTVLTLINTVSLQLQVNDLRAQSAELDKQVARKTLVNQELEESLNEGTTDESIAKLARDVLGYASPGERVFIDSSEQ